MKKLLIPLFLLLILLSSVSLAVPHFVTYQGVLTDNDGNLVNADLPMTFGIYANETAEEPLWEDEYNESNGLVEVRNGLFNVYLGEHFDVNPLFEVSGNPVFNGNLRWLQVTIGNENLDRRIPMVSVPYAYNAEYLQNFSPGDFVRFAIPSGEVQETSETDRIGLLVRSNNNVGVWGQSTNWIGVHGSSSQAAAVVGVSTNGDGIRGQSTNGYAGHFSGGNGLYADGIKTKIFEIDSAVTTSYTLKNDDSVIYVHAGNSDVTITLPKASPDTPGRVYHIYRVDGTGNQIWLKTNGSDKLNGLSGNTGFAGPQWSCIRIVGRGSTSWVYNKF